MRLSLTYIKTTHDLSQIREGALNSNYQSDERLFLISIMLELSKGYDPKNTAN